MFSASRLKKWIGNRLARVFGTDVAPPVDLEGTCSYTVLDYRPSLNEETTIPLFVLIKAPMEGNGGVVFCGLGRTLAKEELETANEIGQEVLKQLNSWLESQLTRALEESESPLEYLAEQSRWNLAFRPPSQRESSAPLKEVQNLFEEKVLSETPEEVVRELEEKTSHDSESPSSDPTPDSGSEPDISVYRGSLQPA